MKRLKLWYWKRRLRKSYTSMQLWRDNASCGHYLLYNISRTYRELIMETNIAIRAINRLDPLAKLKEFMEAP